METIARFLTLVSTLLGKIAAWTVIIMVMAMFASVLARYVFGIVFPELYQVSNWSFGIVLTTCAGLALAHDDHVRIDAFYSRMGHRAKALVNIGGTAVFLVPLLIVLSDKIYAYVWRSWRLREGSQELSGLTAIYILKTFLIVFIVVLALQGIANLIRAVAAYRKGPNDVDEVPMK